MLTSLLSLTIWLPILAGGIVLASAKANSPSMSKWLALFGSIAGFIAALGVFFQFDAGSVAPQFAYKTAWVDNLSIFYAIGVDGISMPFVVLNSFITIFVVIAAWEVITEKPAMYLGAFLLMSGLINGAFAAQDAILFYVFFEAMLIPMYIIIGVWGGPRRVYASIKFFLYTLLGSLLLLIALLYLHSKTGTFAIIDFQQLPITLDVQKWLFIAFFLSFAVKVPMWPVHTWLPDAHVEAPTGGSVVLAAITLKLGAYGFLRFALPIAPDASISFAPVMVALSLIAVVYIGAVALAQTDMKKLIAYSSISHMGFVTLGLFLLNKGQFSALGIEGALVQMVSHGFISAAMFLCIGVLYDRMHTRNIADYGGVVQTMPYFAAFFLLFAMANAGLPATSGFVGEFLVIMAAVKVNFWVAFFAALTLIFGAGYTLWMYKRVIFGPIANDQVKALKDISAREAFMLAILAAAVLGMGLYPEFFIEKMHASVQHLVNHAAQSKLM